MAEQLYSFHNTVLAERKTANPVVTSGTQPPRTLITLDNCGVLWMISAIQHYKFARMIKACSADSCSRHHSVSVAVSVVHRPGFVQSQVGLPGAPRLLVRSNLW